MDVRLFFFDLASNIIYNVVEKSRARISVFSFNQLSWQEIELFHNSFIEEEGRGRVTSELLAIH